MLEEELLASVLRFVFFFLEVGWDGVWKGFPLFYLPVACFRLHREVREGRKGVVVGLRSTTPVRVLL